LFHILKLTSRSASDSSRNYVQNGVNDQESVTEIVNDANGTVPPIETQFKHMKFFY